MYRDPYCSRLFLHSISIQDTSNQIFSPEVALHLMANDFADTELFTCIWCGISHLSQRSLQTHMESDHKSAMHGDISPGVQDITEDADSVVDSDAIGKETEGCVRCETVSQSSVCPVKKGASTVVVLTKDASSNNGVIIVEPDYVHRSTDNTG